MNIDYWTGFLTGVGAFSVIYGALFAIYRFYQRRLDKQKEGYMAILRGQLKEMHQFGLETAIAYDALLHVLRNRNNEGEEWKNG
jgi:uncharacterized membrane protein